MFRYEKDMERMMQEKKREVLRELENAKERILRELSGVDKCTLTKLRQVIADYNKIDYNLSTRLDNYENSINSRLEKALDDSKKALNKSTDALSFTKEVEIIKENIDISLIVDNSNYSFTSIAFGNNIFVACGQDTTTGVGQIFAHSNDGIEWTVNVDKTNGYGVFTDVIFVDGVFIYVGYEGSSTVSPLIATSVDGVELTYYTPSGSYVPKLQSVAYCNGKYVAIGKDSSVKAFILTTSEDGTTWKHVRCTVTASETLYSIACGNEKLICVGSNGACFSGNTTNITGSTLKKITAFTTETLRCAKWLNDRFIVCGSNGSAFYSETGEAGTWEKINLSTSENLYNIDYENGYYLIMGTNGFVAYSTDLTNWKICNTTNEGVTLRDSLYNNDRFIGIGGNGSLYQIELKNEIISLSEILTELYNK